MSGEEVVLCGLCELGGVWRRSAQYSAQLIFMWPCMAEVKVITLILHCLMTCLKCIHIVKQLMLCVLPHFSFSNHHIICTKHPTTRRLRAASNRSQWQPFPKFENPICHHELSDQCESFDLFKVLGKVGTANLSCAKEAVCLPYCACFKDVFRVEDVAIFQLYMTVNDSIQFAKVARKLCLCKR